MINIGFDSFNHKYTINGQEALGVTSTINSIPPEMLYNSHFIRKGQIGTIVHTLAHELKTFGKVKSKKLLTNDTAPYFEGYQKFFKEAGFRVLLSEVMVGSLVWGYCGTVDDISLTPKDRVAVMDIKTSGIVSPTTALQTAGYALAADEMVSKGVEPLFTALAGKKVFERYSIWLTGDGDYKLIQYRDKGDIRVFLSALTFRQWKIRNGMEQ